MKLFLGSKRPTEVPVAVDLTQCEDLKCPACGSVYFMTGVVRVKIVPAVVSPSGQMSFVFLPVLSCAECGYVMDAEMHERENSLERGSENGDDIGLS